MPQMGRSKRAWSLFFVPPRRQVSLFGCVSSSFLLPPNRAYRPVIFPATQLPKSPRRHEMQVPFWPPCHPTPTRAAPSSARMHTNAHLPRPRLRNLALLNLKIATRLSNDRGLHLRHRSSPRVSAP